MSITLTGGNMSVRGGNLNINPQNISGITTTTTTTTTSTTTTTTTAIPGKLTIEQKAAGDNLGTLTFYLYQSPVGVTISNTTIGSLLVVTVMGGPDFGAGQAPATASVSSRPALTWTRRVKTQPGSGQNSTNVDIWTALNTVGGTISASASWKGNSVATPGVVASQIYMYSLIYQSQIQPIGNTASIFWTSTSTGYSASIFGNTNSIVIGAVGDYDTANPPPGTYVGPNIVVDNETNNSALNTTNYYNFHGTLTQSGTYSFGVINPSIWPGLGLIEIRSATYSSATLSFYAQANGDQNNYIGSAMNDAIAQSFQSTYNVSLYTATFNLDRLGSPTGTIYANLYAHTGSFGTTGFPTGPILATSSGINAASIAASTMVTFTFSGGSQYGLTSGGYYAIAAAYNGGDASNAIRVVVDISSPTDPGRAYYLKSGTWFTTTQDPIGTSGATDDAVFTVRGIGYI